MMGSVADYEAVKGFMEEHGLICATSEINYLNGRALDEGDGAEMSHQEISKEEVGMRDLPKHDLEL